MIDPQVAYDKLAQFQTADELAEFFKSEQVVGWRARSQSCPIANWMRSVTGKVAEAYNPIRVFDKDYTDTFEASYAMSDFMEKFDSGGYPDLDHPDAAPYNIEY